MCTIGKPVDRSGRHSNWRTRRLAELDRQLRAGRALPIRRFWIWGGRASV